MTKLNPGQSLILSTRSKPYKLLFVLVMGLVLAMYSPGCSHSSEQSELVRKLLNVSGLGAQLSNIHSALWLALPSDAFLHENQRNSALRNFRKALSSDELVSIAQNAFQIQFDAEKIELAIKFFETGPGRKLARVQKESLTNNNIRNIRESRRTAALLDDKRLELITRIIETHKAAEANSDLANMLIRSLLAQGIGQEGGKAPLTGHKTRASSAALEKNLIDETVLLSYANNLRSFDDKELEALISFFESPEGKWFETTSDLFIGEIVSKLGEALAQTLSQQSQQIR